MKKILLIMFSIMLVTTLVSATDYLPHKQNLDFTLVVTSNNATACNLSSIQYPDGSQVISNTPLTKDGQTFYLSMNKGNYSQLGSVCHHIICGDGATTETGSVCREITPSGFGGTLGFYFILLLVIGALVVLGFSIKDGWFVIFGSLGLISLGIYSINSGIAGFRDMFMTWSIGLFEIGVGAYLGVNSGLEMMTED